jgi:hypothetical protein
MSMRPASLSNRRANFAEPQGSPLLMLRLITLSFSGSSPSASHAEQCDICSRRLRHSGLWVSTASSLRPVFFAILLQPDEIGPFVLIRREDILTTVSALPEVMGTPANTVLATLGIRAL